MLNGNAIRVLLVLNLVAMFAANLKQFSIKHLFIGLLAFAVSMGLATAPSPASYWGFIGLGGCLGVVLATISMFISDVIDDRPVDDRRLSSRFFNFVGLLIFVVTFFVVVGVSVFLLPFTCLVVIDNVVP